MRILCSPSLPCPRASLRARRSWRAIARAWLEDPIAKWLPEFSAVGTAEDPCQPPTVRMLFGISGGLTEDNSWVDPFIDATEQDLLAQVSRGLRYSHLPGTAYEYSNLGYALAGLSVARAVGQPIKRFVENEVLAPLGLTSTCFAQVNVITPGV